MANTEIVAHVGDTAVRHSKTIMWSTIDSTKSEPLREIFEDTGQNIVKELWNSSDATVNSRLRAGYEAYLTLWNGTDGEFRMAVYEAFVRFEDLTIPAHHIPAVAMVQFRLRGSETVQVYGSYNGGTYYGSKPYHQGGTIVQDLFLQRYTSGQGATGVLTPADWYDSLDVSVVNSRGYINDASNSAFDVFMSAGNDALLADVVERLADTSGAELQYVLINDNTNFSTTGTFTRRGPWYYTTLYSASDPQDPNRVSAPRMIVGSIPKSPLVDVLGASIQLSDGSHVYLEKGTNEVKVMRKTTPAAAATQIGSVATGLTSSTFLASASAYQTFDLCRDAADNIYVVGTAGHDGKTSIARAFKQSVVTPGVWTGQTVKTTAPTSSYLSTINNRSCTWTPSTNPSYPGGFVLVTYAHRMGSSGTNGQYGQQAVMALDASVLLGDKPADPVLRSSSLWDPRSSENWMWPRNAMGTGLDTTTIYPQRTVMLSFSHKTGATQANERDEVLWGKITNDEQGVVVNVSNSTSQNYRTLTGVKHDPATKFRALNMHSSTLYGVAYHGNVRVFDWDNTIVTDVDLTTQGIPGFPSRATIGSSANWDVWYNKSNGTFWIYFVDSSNPRRLLRVGYNHVTDSVIDGAAPVQMATNVGPSGSKIVAIRIPREQVDERWIHIDMGVLGADGAESLVALEDTSFNVPPQKPVLEDIVPFNASTAGTFRWSFNDDNPSDVHAAYELEIKRVSDNVVVYDPGVVAGPLVNGEPYANHTNVTVTLAGGTLTNNTTYQARVRSHDAFGAISSWSDWKSFATSSTGGMTVIVDPPYDNAPIEGSTVALDWEFTHTGNATQTGYRIRVFLTSDNVLLQDTGVVNSTNTQAIVSNLVSDIEQRIEVVVTDSTAEDSAPGIRLVTPNFDDPQAPQIQVVAGEAFIEVRVTNPVPGTDQPQVIRNDVYRRDSGTTEWVRIGQTIVNGVYRDYSVASGKQYDYMVRGVS